MRHHARKYTLPKLLLVDDTPTNLLLIQRRIRKHLPECEVLLASSPEEALQIAERDRPDCAILDLYMPRFNGIELARELKARQQGNNYLILIVTSGDAEAGVRVQALEAGADDFIDRSSTEMELVSKIRVLLRIKNAEEGLRIANRRLSQLAGERSAALQETADRFNAIFEAGSDLVLVFELDALDNTARVLEANPSACHNLGYQREVLLRTPVTALFSREFALQWPLRVEALIRHRQVCFDATFVRKSGRTVQVTLHARLVETTDARSVIAVCQPIARTDSSTTDSGRRYRLVASQTGQLFYEVEVADMVIRVSGAFTQVTGRPSDDIGQLQHGQWNELIHPDDREHVMETFADAVRSLGKYHMQWRLMHTDGSVRFVEDLGVVLPGEDGRAKLVLGTLQDITPRVQAEEERQRAERLEQHTRKLESLGVLAGGIAHDFNNLLAAIIGLTDMAVQDLDPESQLHADLSEVLRAGHRAKDLVRQILKFSRQEQEDRRPVYFHQIAREALKLLRATIPPHIEIIDAIDTISGQTLGSASQLHQVVMNLCTNSAHAISKQPGTIEVCLADVEIDARFAATHPQLHEGPYLKLSVFDTGHGMDERVMARIFDPFFTTKPVGEGTGMGLAVVHGIVSSHGGAILVNSKPGHGSAFYVYLPRADRVEEEGERSTAPPATGHERILFVDDEEAVLRFARAALQPIGYSVTLCEDPQVALELFRKAPGDYDLLVSDLMMPKLMGDALAEAVRALKPGIPIVLFTGFGDFLSPERIEEAGVCEIVHKPIIARDLAEAVRRALDKKPFARS